MVKSMLVLHHFTLRPLADRIMREGFRDGEPEVIAGVARVGVWFADVSLADDEGLPRDQWATLILEVPEEEVADFEVVGNPMVRAGSHREWCIPAADVNRWFGEGAGRGFLRALKPPEVFSAELPRPERPLLPH